MREDHRDLLHTAHTFQAALNKAGKMVPTGWGCAE